MGEEVSERNKGRVFPSSYIRYVHAPIIGVFGGQEKSRKGVFGEEYLGVKKDGNGTHTASAADSLRFV